jgi:hypothetical protein
MKLTYCCGAEFYEDTDICKECKEHSDEQEEHDCCQSKENGFDCTCLPSNGIQEEDDGRGDYDRDCAKDREFDTRFSNQFCEDCD